MSWAARVYECDKCGAVLCRDMAIAGMGFDLDEARTASLALREAEREAWARAEAAVNRTLRAGNAGGFSTTDLRAAFFRDLKAPAYIRSEKTGAPSLSVDVLRAFSAAHDERLRALAVAVLEWRRARKIRATYIDAIVPGSDGRVHSTWKNYGTVSGRYSCEAPNLMNLPRPETDPTILWRDLDTGEEGVPYSSRRNLKAVRGGIRGLFRAKPGCLLVAADAKQLEMRIAANASGDEAMIAATESSDLHAANAAVIFGEAFTSADGGARKALRTLAKSAGFAVCYMAEADTVYARIIASGTPCTLPQVKAMLARLREGFADYFRWQDRGLLDVVRRGWVASPLLGRRRWLGHEPAPTEAANFPIQAGAADLMNERLPMIVSELRRLRIPARLVAQVHDSGVFECEASAAEECAAVYKRVFEAPIVISSSGRPIEARFPVDVDKPSERWH